MTKSAARKSPRTRAQARNLAKGRNQQPLTLAQAKKLIQQHPEQPSGWKALGTILVKAGQHSESLDALSHAQELAPNDHEIYDLLATAEAGLGNPEKAIGLLNQALEINPRFAQGHFSLAKVLNNRAQHMLAIEHINQAIELAPNRNDIFSYKGNILIGLHCYDEAIAVFDELIKRQPKNYSHWNNAANLRRDTGRLEEADKYYRKAIELTSSAVPFSNRLTALHYQPSYSREAILEVCKEWDARFAPSQVAPRPSPIDRTPQRRIRIGMVSDGFRQHPVGRMIVTVLENLKDSGLETYAYSTNDAADPLTIRIRHAVDKWLPIQHLSDENFSQKIRDDEIDILIDLCGHNSGNRMQVMAQEPAPLIVKWVGGLINTTGLKAIDYLISDNIETPPGVDNFYTEKLIRLPNDYICYAMPNKTPEVQALPALKNDYITFGCFNNPTKTNDVLLAEWAKLMHCLPASRLFLKGHQYNSPELCDRIRDTLASHGVSNERLTIEGPSRHFELLEAYNRVDIALDPWPYSGGLTTCEAMLMGVPVVTMPGPTFAGRHSATHLTNAGMPELVTNSWDEYRQRIIGLASDLQSLSTIRTHLRDILLQSPVCDGPNFAKHFTAAMRAIWQRYCEGKAPAALMLNKQSEAQFEDEQHPVEILHLKAIEDGVEDQSTFRWQFQGKITVIDNGAGLTSTPEATKLLKLNAFSMISFDPASKIADAKQLHAAGELHHYPHAVLGDGKPATLHACLDPAMSATLRPLSAIRTLTGEEEGPKILATLPVNTIQLDKIEGLGSIDWLILDNMNDSLAVLENGEKALVDTLLIQARINFQATHENQPELTLISHWAARHGFSFYRLNDPTHISHLPKRDDLVKQQATQLASADALYVPNAERMTALTDNQRMKLAFVLHTVYGVKDLVYGLLGEVDKERAEGFLEEEGLLKAKISPAGTIIEVNLSGGICFGSFPESNSRIKPSSEREISVDLSGGINLIHQEIKFIQANRNNCKKKAFIHICFNNMHVQPLIKILNEKEASKDFDHFVFIEKRRSIPNYDVDISGVSNAEYFDKNSQLNFIKNQCLQDSVEGIFFHGLFFDWQKELIKTIKNKKKIVWSIWGGDLYNPINEKKPLVEEVRYIDAITTVEIGDYKVFRKTYGEKMRLEFRYPGNVELSEIHIPATKKKRIIIGNSGDPSNNHIEIIKILATKNDIKDYLLVIPMSYSAPPEYIFRIKKELADKGLLEISEILEHILPTKEYLELLADSEILITAHRRQQAVGNLAASIYFGNKTILRKEFHVDNSLHKNPVWEAFSEKEFPIFDFEEFRNLPSIKSIPAHGLGGEEYNKSKIEFLYGKQRVITLAKQAFLEIAQS